MNTQRATDNTLTAGTIIGGYRLERLVGLGDNAEVWLATNVGDGVMVALKVMNGDVASRCYAAARCVEHPNIVRPSAMFNHDNKSIIVMPLCVERSVEGLAGYASERQAWQLLSDIASALVALHAAGMAHGNICLKNILWDGERFKLTGFTSSRAVADGGRLADDIWQLGATVFHLCMGCHVFNGMGMKAQQLSSPLPYMRKSMPQLSEAVQRCLAYNGRPSAEEVVAMTKTGKMNYTIVDRKQKAASIAVRRFKDDFWPDEMRRIVMVFALLLCSLNLPAQSIVDAELSDLVEVVIRLREDRSKEAFNEVKSILLNDELWTQMCELGAGPPRDGECRPSDPVECFELNFILTQVDNIRTKRATQGNALNGQDSRYFYSLYELSLKAGAEVKYDLTGRKGEQTFVIVPFAGKDARLYATVTIGGKPKPFKEDAERGLLIVNTKDQLIQEEIFYITVRNVSDKAQSFVIINHNTQKP